MARIPTYELDQVFDDNDLLLGTDGATSALTTKNFSLAGLAEYVIDKLIDPDATSFCIPVFRDPADTQGANATRITSSIIQQNTYPNGSNISVSGTLDAIKKIQVKGNGSIGGQLELNCEQNSHGVTIQSPPHSAGAAYTMILPDNMGVDGQQLTTNGVDTVYWAPSDDDNLNVEGDSGNTSVDLDSEELRIRTSSPHLSTVAGSPGGGDLTINFDPTGLVQGSGVANNLAYWSSSNSIKETTNITFSETNVAKLTLGDGLNTPGEIELLQYSPKITLGSGFTITHPLNGAATISEVGSDDLHIYSDNEVEIRSGLMGETFARFTKDGPIELYYDNVKTFETTSTGITVTGAQSSFTGQVTIPATPVANTDAASKAYVDSQALDLIQTDITITSAQLLSLDGGATIQLIPAPGANKIIAILNALIHLDYGTVTYNFAAAGLSDGVGLSYGTQQIQGDNGFFTNNLNSSSDTYFIGDPLGVSAGTNMTPNQPLNLISTSGVSVSQGNSPIKMSILYREISIPFTQA